MCSYLLFMLKKKICQQLRTRQQNVYTRFLLPAFEKLKNLIEEKKLNASIEEKQDMDIGMGLLLTCEIRMDGQTTKTSITAMESIWKEKGKSNIENAGFVASAWDLVEFIKSLLKP